MFLENKKLLLWNVIGLMVLGTMLEAALVSEVDSYCLDSPGSNYNDGIRPIFYACHGGNNQAFSWNRNNITICSKSVCISSLENTKDQAPIFQKSSSAIANNEYGGHWWLRGGLITNQLGLCMQREEPKDNVRSQIIQAKCDFENKWQKFRFV